MDLCFISSKNVVSSITEGVVFKFWMGTSSKKEKDIVQLALDSINIKIMWNSRFSRDDQWHHRAGSWWSEHGHFRCYHECGWSFPRWRERGSYVCCWSATIASTCPWRQMHNVCRCRRAMSCGCEILQPTMSYEECQLIKKTMQELRNLLIRSNCNQKKKGFPHLCSGFKCLSSITTKPN